MMFDLYATFGWQISRHRRHVGTLIAYYIYWCHTISDRNISRSEFRSTRLWELAEVCDALLTGKEEEQ